AARAAVAVELGAGLERARAARPRIVPRGAVGGGVRVAPELRVERVRRRLGRDADGVACTRPPRGNERTARGGARARLGAGGKRGAARARARARAPFSCVLSSVRSASFMSSSRANSTTPTCVRSVSSYLTAAYSAVPTTRAKSCGGGVWRRWRRWARVAGRR